MVLVEIAIEIAIGIGIGIVIDRCTSRFTRGCAVPHHIDYENDYDYDYDNDNDNDRDPCSAFGGDNQVSSVCGESSLDRGLRS